jgi:uncharacterized paraquat-inducible protein A
MKCPHCNMDIEVGVGNRGKVLECGWCGGTFLVREKSKRGSSTEQEKPTEATHPKERESENADEYPPSLENGTNRKKRYCNSCGIAIYNEALRCKRCAEESITRNRVNEASPTLGPGFGIASMVLGIVSLVLSCLVGCLAVPLPILAIVFGVLGLNRQGRGMAISGLVMGLASILISVVFLALYGLLHFILPVK